MLICAGIYTQPTTQRSLLFMNYYYYYYYYYYYDSEDVWMPYGSLSSKAGASNITQAAQANNSIASKACT